MLVDKQFGTPSIDFDAQIPGKVVVGADQFGIPNSIGLSNNAVACKEDDGRIALYHHNPATHENHIVSLDIEELRHLMALGKQLGL